MKSKLTHCLPLVSILLIGGSLSSHDTAAAADKDPSEAFFTNGIIPRLRIELDAAAQASLRQNSRRYVKATVTESNRIYREVGLHLKGGMSSFRQLDNTPCLTLNFNKFVAGQKFHGIDKLHLNNSVQDRTFMNELIGGEMFRQAGIPAPRVSHARVELNGRDLGFYVLVEGFDKTFLRRHFAHTHGNFYDGGEATDVFDPLKKSSGEGPNDRSDLRALAAAAGEPASNRLDRLATMLDMDRFHTYLAMEVLLRHWDGYAMAQNNYRLYNDPASHRFVFLPHGMDQLFDWPQGSILPDCRGYVAWSILDTPGGRRRQRERCVSLFTNLFSIERLTNRVNALEERIRPVLVQMSPRLVQAHEQAVERLRQKVSDRIAFLHKELEAPALQPLVFDSDGMTHLTNWTANLNGGQARFAEVDDPKPSLQIRNVGEHVPFVASWRTRVLLPSGHYRFQGKVRTAGFRPMTSAPGGGVSLRVFGYTASAPRSMAGDHDWESLETGFTLPGPEEEIELICEVRAYKGTVWIDKSSLVKMGLN